MTEACVRCGRRLEHGDKTLLGKTFRTCRLCREISRRATQTCRIKQHQRTHVVPIETYRPKMKQHFENPTIETSVVDDKILCCF